MRSWCFTILTGGFAALGLTGALSGPWYSPCILLLALPAIAAFKLIEERQRQFGARLAARAALIELTWSRVARAAGKPSGSTPRLARHLIHEAVRDVRPVSPVSMPVGPALNTLAARAPTNRASKRDYFVVNADTVFYWMQYVLVTVIVAALVVYKLIAPPLPHKTETGAGVLVRVSSNEFRFFCEGTNVLFTNFVIVPGRTTNFQVVTLLTTNYITTNALTHK